MAERVPPPADDINDDNSSQSSKTEITDTNSNCFGHVHATYVVQVPKDQIYRIPPPENATIAERHRYPARNDKVANRIRPCASRCCCVLLSLIVLVLALGLSATVLSLYFESEDPKFHVERLDIMGLINRTTDQHRNRVTLRSENPNDRVDVSYKEGGVVSLWFREWEIGVGQFPAFRHAHANSTVFDVVLNRGKSVGIVDQQIRNEELDQKSRNKQKAPAHHNVKLHLKMDNVTAKTDHVGTWITGILRLAVACDVTVDYLAKGSRVLSQECLTTRQD